MEPKDSAPGPETRIRPVRSFVRRNSRITRAQQRALDTLWPRFGADISECQDLDRLFGRGGAHVLEIGFGMGDALLSMAAEHREMNFLGIDIHEPGIGRVMAALEHRALSNVRVVCGDAMELLTHQLSDACLDRIAVFFPDPWPKKRHHKRRLVQVPFLRQCTRVLRHRGVVHLATDWEPYAQAMVDALNAVEGLRQLKLSDTPLAASVTRASSRFEQRGLRLGHAIRDIEVIKWIASESLEATT